MSGVSAVTVLAHGGGIPEIATAVVPVALLIGILYAGRRKERAERERQDEASSPPPASEDGAPADDSGDQDSA